MRMAWAAAAAAWLGAAWLGAPAAALEVVGCAPYEEAAVADAVDAAAVVARQAAAEAGEGSALFRFWFGEPDRARAERVRANLKRLEAQLLDPRLAVECVDRKAQCAETYAYVTNTPGVIRVCPDWFRMPSLQAGDGAGVLLESGTREGTIIHEASHFAAVAGTGDACYDRTPCALLAARDPALAVGTADNHQFFSEDVALDRAARAAREGGEGAGAASEPTLAGPAPSR